MKKVREGYKMTELGEIPSEWEVKNIGEVAKFQGGYAFKSSDYVDSGIRLIKITNVQQKNILWNEEDLLPINYLEKFNEYTLQEDDVVIAMTRPIISAGIKVCKIEKRDLPCLLNQRVGRFIIKDSLISKYLYNYCFTDYFINKVKELCSTTGQPNISANQIESILITIPSVKEQEKIGSILSTVDEQIDNVNALIEKNKELKKGLMQTLLTKGIGHTKFKKTEIGEIPEEWELESMNEIVTSTQLGTNTLGKENEKIPMLKMGNLTIGGFDFNKLEYISEEELEMNREYILSNGDFLFNTRNTLDLVGKSAVWNGQINKAIFNSNIMRIKYCNKINDFYMGYYFSSDIGWKQLKSISTGTTSVAAIYTKDLMKVKVIIPSVNEQEKIVSILSEVDKKIGKYENKKQNLEKLKKGLMQQLLSGNIRV